MRTGTRERRAGRLAFHPGHTSLTPARTGADVPSPPATGDGTSAARRPGLGPAVWRQLPAVPALAAGAARPGPQVLLLGKLPDTPDYWAQEFVPLAVLRRGLLSGELPLWNGQLAAGTPHLADPQSAVLYPLTTLPLLVLSPAAVARLSIPLHFFLA